ncbi:growth hormone secretagogue receptor type 1-like [Plakobranchus ocellatus]|uniref:Growth hormone secretagogue receptor type 1-like n=1 Tax=Plakobranchus ocellatus TaxID=259542 RepID=A0AAV3ZDQ5_9GAST|nr:growth hormone secretagogue receptor type 1-like [Plakobranchus ocellatus]
MLVVGDAIVHLPVFGYDNTDAVGEWLIDLMNGSMTSLVSERSEPTYLYSRGVLFRPDIALVSTDFAESTTREIFSVRPQQQSQMETRDQALRNVHHDSMPISEVNEALNRVALYAARRGIPGELLHACRKAVMVPILKKGKSATAAESYGSVSLTSVICKTMGRMVNVRLYRYFEQSACLHKFQ